MRQNRKNWSAEEDEHITSLVKKYGTKRWTLISQKMKERFSQDSRSGKQCRERWHNHLSPIIKKQPWTEEELKLVFNSHRKFGNRWTEIAQLLQGRTDNAVKNQFYSTLRKGLRRMCKVLGTRNSTSRIKKIKPNALSNLISNITQIPIGDDENDQQLYDMLFEFSNGDKYQQLKERSISQKQKQKMEKLLERILQSKDVSKKRKGKVNAVNGQNEQLGSPKFEENKSVDNKVLQDMKPLTFHQFPSQKPNKFEFNINFDNEGNEKENFNFYQSPKQRVFQGTQMFEDYLDYKLDKPIALKRQNSQIEAREDDIPLKKKDSEGQKLARKGNQFGNENNQNEYKCFLSKSPNFSSKVRMPTPRLHDTHHIFSFPSLVDDSLKNEQPEKEYNDFVQQLKNKVGSRIGNERVR